MKLKNAFLTLSTLSLLAVGAAAQGEPRGPHKPPQEAFAACASAAAGDACTVSFHEHEMKGTCEAFGSEGLACRPSGFPSGPPPSPPQD